jgi:hypothetical protein
MTLKESILLSAAVGFFLIWVGEVFKNIPLKESYFWVMFSLGCLFYFQYTKNVRLKREAAEKKAGEPAPSPKRPAPKARKK